MRLKKIVTRLNTCLLVASLFPIVSVSPFSLDVNADDLSQTSETSQIRDSLQMSKYLEKLPISSTSDTEEKEDKEIERNTNESEENSTVESTEESKNEKSMEQSKELNEPEQSKDIKKTEPSSKSLRLLSVDGASAEVASWDELKTAMTTETIEEIVVTKDIVVADIFTVNRKVEVDFKGHLLNLMSNSIYLNSSAIVTFKNLLFTGQGAGSSIFQGEGTARFSGDVESKLGNEAGIAQLPSAMVIFDGVKLTYDRSGIGNEAVNSKNLLIENESVIKSGSITFYRSNYTTSIDGEVIIKGNSKVETNGTKTNATKYAVWDVITQKKISVIEKSELIASSNANAPSGIFRLNSSNSSINVSDSSMVSVKSKVTTALSMGGGNGVFNVTSNSTLDIESDTSGVAALRFIQSTNNTFNIDGNSKIVVNKKLGKGPAISMSGSNNQINVKGGSDFITTNYNRSILTPDDTNNIGIEFGIGSGSQFNIEGKNSSVFISADKGRAIDSKSDLTITAGPETFFIARGKTKGTTSGIFKSTKKLDFRMDSTSYFDFANANQQGIFECPTDSIFSSNNSNLAVWKKTSKLNKRPDFSWNTMSFSLSGANFVTIDSSTNLNMKNKFKSMNMSNYARMTANNQAAIVDDIRVPTDADKKIYAHASVPEEKGVIRDAYSGEVKVLVGLYAEDSQLIKKLEALSIDSISVYGDTPREGMIEFQVPDDRFLKISESIKALDAWRTNDTNDMTNESNFQSKQEDIIQTQPSVVDVTPPMLVDIEGGLNISPAQAYLSGTGEVNSAVFVSVNGGPKISPNIIVDDNGKWRMSLSALNLKKYDNIQVFLQDQSGQRTEITGPPVTNNEIGNINPSKDLAYHDAIFKAAPIVRVSGKLILKEIPTIINFGVNSIKNKTVRLAPQVGGNLTVSDTRDKKQTWKLTVSQAIPFTNGSQTISDILSYIKTNGEEVAISSIDQVIEQRKSASDADDVVSSNWNTKQDATNRGLRATVPVDKQLIGDYQGTLSWKLQDVPGN